MFKNKKDIKKIKCSGAYDSPCIIIKNGVTELFLV